MDNSQHSVKAKNIITKITYPALILTCQSLISFTKSCLDSFDCHFSPLSSFSETCFPLEQPLAEVQRMLGNTLISSSLVTLEEAFVYHWGVPTLFTFFAVYT